MKTPRELRDQSKDSLYSLDLTKSDIEDLIKETYRKYPHVTQEKSILAFSDICQAIAEMGNCLAKIEIVVSEDTFRSRETA